MSSQQTFYSLYSYLFRSFRCPLHGHLQVSKGHYATEYSENQLLEDALAVEGCATYTVDEVAKILGIGRATAYAALRKGIVPAFRIGRRFVVPKAAIEAWLRNAPAPCAGEHQ